MSRQLRLVHAAGDLIGPWQLIAPLGCGGFSEVWRARHEAAPGFIAALKILVHEDHVAELRKEESALALVRGEGIVRTLEANLAHDPPYLALALLSGGDLRDRLVAEEGRFFPSDALRITERILEILGRVHREGIVHGDLKPENVLFDARGELHLADFGLSRRIAQRSATLSVSLSLADARLAGTIEYMAPEQREGAKPTARSDVYAAGVILHELLTGERPQGVFDLPGKKDPGLPPLVDRTLAGALALDPRDRFEDAGAMLKFLRLGLWNDGQGLRATAAGLRDRGVIAGDYAVVWGGTLALLAATTSGETVRDVPTFLAITTGLATATIPIAVVLPGLRRWNARLTRDLANIERQLDVLRGWREPDAIKVVEAWAPDVVKRARRRRGTVSWVFGVLRVATRRLLRRCRRSRRNP